MKKYLIPLGFCLIAMLVSAETQALWKTDVGGAAAEVTKTVSGWLENGKKKMDESVAVQTIVIQGKGAIETAKQIQQLKTDVEEKKDALKEDPLGAGLDIAGDAAGKIGLEENDKYSQAMEKLNEKTADAQKLADLDEQKAKLTEEMNKKLAAEQKATQAKIDSYDKNTAALKQMIKDNPEKADEYKAQITKNEASKKALQAGLEISTKELSAPNLASLTDVNSQIGALNDKLQARAEAAKEKVAKELKDKLLGSDSAGALNETVEKNYIPKNSPEDAASISKTKTYRSYVAAQDLLTVASQVALEKQKLDENTTETKKIADRVGATDGYIAAINMDTQVKVQNIVALGGYIEMMIRDLKMRTSEELGGAQDSKQQGGSGDITTFSLDDYIYEPEGSSGGGK